MTTIDLPDADIQQITAEALAGPWEAVLAWNTGEVTTLDDIDGNYIGELGAVYIAIVRRSAAPTGPDAGGEKRLPGTYNADDLLVEFDGFGDIDEVITQWAQAQAMAAGLNATAAQPAHDPSQPTPPLPLAEGDTVTVTMPARVAGLPDPEADPGAADELWDLAITVAGETEYVSLTQAEVIARVRKP